MYKIKYRILFTKDEVQYFDVDRYPCCHFAVFALFILLTCLEKPDFKIIRNA